MTNEQTTQAQKLRDEGISYQKIGVALGVSRGAIDYNLNPARRKYCVEWYKTTLKHRQEYRYEYHNITRNI